MTRAKRVKGQAGEPDSPGRKRKRDGILGSPATGFALDRRAVEALALELKFLAASYGLNVMEFEIVSSTRTE